ncbi:MAG: VIT family protein [Bdellovibrionales bacterium]
MFSTSHPEKHRIGRSNWLRAAVLGANDGIISTASLIVGVASATSSLSEVIIAGVAGMIAGAMSMAAGEYVSVSSQVDIESADLERERQELIDDPDFETEELAQIYVNRGLEYPLAQTVAIELMKKDALGAHARDELGLSDTTAPRPLQAAFASAAAFILGASLPILTLLIAPQYILVPSIFVSALVFLALLGLLGARTGGAGSIKPMLRVTFWGAFAMAVTAGVGALVGKVL